MVEVHAEKQTLNINRTVLERKVKGKEEVI